MAGLENFCLGLFLDLGTKSTFFLLFIQSFYYYYKKGFPDSKIELSLSFVANILILTNFDRRLPAGIYFFTVSTSLKFLGQTESVIIGSFFLITILNLRFLPVELEMLLFLYLSIFFLIDPRKSVGDNGITALMCIVIIFVSSFQSQYFDTRQH